MEIKYEAVFGPQELFDSAVDTINEDALIVLAHNSYKVFFQNIEDAFSWMQQGTSHRSKCINKYAMRRIIRTPTWSITDQKVGKLPDVGCLVVSKTGKVSEIVAIKNGYFVMFECGKSNGPLTMHGDLLMKQFKPIESPEEKAARLREEWCKKAIGCAPISSEMQHYEMKRLGGYIEDIYDALLSGDLPVPVNGE